MQALADIYWVQFKVRLALQFQYRVSMMIWLLGGLVEPIIYLVVWQTVAESQGGSVGTYSASDFAAYYIALMFVKHLTFTWIMYEYEYYIRHGTLSGLLLRPIHPIHKDIAENIAYKLMTLVVLIPVGGLLVLLFQPTFNLKFWSVLAFIPALFFAAVLRFITGWTLAMSAFWVTRVSAFNSLYHVLLVFFSGHLAPLELFPQSIQWIAAGLPFRWMLSFPLELFLGRLTLQETLMGYGAQLFWIGICLWIWRVVWQAGVRQFSSVGA